MDIIALIENTVDKSKDLINEKGLCLYIKKDNNNILFDVGKSNNFISNARKLGINIKDIDIVIISHGHHDHGDGLLAFFRENTKGKVYMKKEASKDYYFKFMFFNRSIRINEEIFKKYSDRIIYIDDFKEIYKDIYIITDINKRYEIAKGNKYMFISENGNLTRDTFNHELIMVIKEDNGISIFTGCSHNGVANMIKTVKSIFYKEKIKALIGGFHLIKIPILKSLKPSRDEIDILSNIIINENIEAIYTGHCTGEKAYKELKNILGERIKYLSTGTKIQI